MTVVTVGLVFIFLGIVGIVAMLAGLVLEFMAAAMSDNPYAMKNMKKTLWKTFFALLFFAALTAYGWYGNP